MQCGRKRCLAQTVSRGKDTASSASMTKLRVQVSRIGTLQHRPSQGGSKGPCTQIVRKYSHFVLWEAFFQAKLYYYSPKIKHFDPPIFGLATPLLFNKTLSWLINKTLQKFDPRNTSDLLGQMFLLSDFSMNCLLCIYLLEALLSIAYINCATRFLHFLKTSKRIPVHICFVNWETNNAIIDWKSSLNFQG